MGLTTTLDAPFFGGSSASTTEVPGRFPVALNGRPYQLDLKSGRFGRRSIPLVRAQADDSVTPGEGSISREDLWRSTINDWSHGAGQVQYDRPDSDPRRFRSSKGIDVWDRWELSLLPATDQKRASVNTNLALVTAGAYLYVADGNEVFWTQDATVDSPVWTSSVIHVAEAAQSVKSITSDGYYVYAALGSNGVHRTVRGATTSAHHSDLSATLLAYVKGRLMASNGNALYNITASGTAPSALYTHPNTDFCVDEATEVLTRRGWVKHDDLSTADEALTLDPYTDSIAWQPVLQVNRFDWNGTLERWHSTRIDALTTPSHRWMTKSNVANKSSVFLTTEELHDKPHHLMVVGGGDINNAFADSATISDELVELLGWVITEGYMRTTQRHGRNVDNSVIITQSMKNPGHVERIRGLGKHFAAQGATCSVYERQSGIVDFYFGAGISQIIRGLIPDKQLPAELLSLLTHDQALLLYRTLLDGDGHVRAKGSHWFQKDSERLDAFQMLCSMLGYRTHRRQPSSDGRYGEASAVAIYRQRHVTNRSLRKSQEHYEGVVWCPTTPSGTWLARRNGTTYWTGNSWVGFAEGQGHLYAAGYSGDKSLVYRSAVKSDGTALDVPVVAGELPDGEIVRSIHGYLGFVVIGTDLGVRFATADSNGNLTLGALIRTDRAVHAFEGQERFVWFGWPNYDGASTGLGRLDLSTVGAAGLSPLTPAYASDLMAAAQGSVLSVVTFQDRRVFAVSGSGIWGQDSALVASGSLDSGKITYGLADLKVAMYADIRHLALQGTVSEYLSTDGGSFVLIGTNSTPGSLAPAATFPAGQARGESFELRTTLARATTDTTTGPTVTRMTLRSFPSPARGRYFQVPLLLHDTVLVGDSPVDVDVVTELGLVESLESSRDLVTYQEGAMSYTVLVEDTEWVAYDRTQSGEFWNGTLVVTLKKFSDT